MLPLLSVIIASYNHEKYIAKTLKSIEDQTFQNFEILIIDDGSPDGTVSAAKAVNSRAQIFTQENKGMVEARNRGVTLSKGKYICFIDSDDLITPDRFEKQISVFETNPSIGLVYSDALIIDSDDNVIGKYSDVYPVKKGNTAEMLIMHYCFIIMITVMVRKEILLKAGLFEEPGHISDYVKWIEISHLSETYYDPKPLGYWRRHRENTSKKTDYEKKYFIIRMSLRKIFRKCPELKKNLGNKIKKRFADTYFLSGFFAATTGDIEKTKKYYAKSCKINPTSIRNILAITLCRCIPSKMVIVLHKYVKSKKLPW